jgi:uncharacterized protein (TIGR03437 family)
MTWRHSAALVAALLLGGGATAAVSPGLSIVSGNGQVVWEQFRTQVPMLIQARDANGNPVPDLPITWAITQGQGTLNAAQSSTGADGQASTYFVGTSVPAGLSFTQETITASSSLGSVSFVITTSVNHTVSGSPADLPLAELISPPEEDRNITGNAGSTLAGAVVVLVAEQAGAQSGYPVPNVGVRIVNADDLTQAPAASCQGGLVLTDAKGFATCDLVLTGAPGTYALAALVGEYRITPNFFLTITPGPACTFTLSAYTLAAGAAGGTGTVGVTAGSGCTWQAASNASWITITSGASGTGNGTVGYSVAANAGSARSGTVTIADQTLTINQSAPGGPASLAITTPANLPAAVASAAYTVTIAATGGSAPYAFSSDTLPAGLSLNASTGAISGVPASVGNFTFTVTVTDSTGATANQTFNLAVVTGSSGSPPAITNTSFPNGVVGTAYQVNLTSTPGCASPFSPPPVFSVVSGSLPPGLGVQTITQRTYAITGTPTAAGVFSFTLQVTDPCGRSSASSFSITVTTSGGGGGGGGGTPTVTAAPVSVLFTVPVGSSAAVADQTVNINASTATQYIASVVSLSGGSWLSIVGASTGTTPGVITLHVSNYATLPSNSYLGGLVISAGGSTIQVPVTLQVLPAPTLGASAGALAFGYQSGIVAPAPQLVAISSTGGDLDITVTATTQSGGQWLFVSPSTGTTPVTLSVSVNPTGLAVGPYQGAITIRSSIPSVAPLTIPMTLTVAQPQPSIGAVTNAASFQPGSVAAGEYITIFGSGLGPATGVSGSANAEGLLGTNVSDTVVTFDGVPAPVLYTSDSQVSAIVPYSVEGKTTTTVQVDYRGLDSTPLSVNVAEAAPGIFTISSQGQAAALNQDGSVNSPSNGADPGAYVSIYATGGGQTTPAGIDGLYTGTDILPRQLQDVKVEVGGLEADVPYAGDAPYFPAGAMQVNFVVPDGVQRGVALPVVVTVDGVPSQTGVTIFIRP